MNRRVWFRYSSQDAAQWATGRQRNVVILLLICCFVLLTLVNLDNVFSQIVYAQDLPPIRYSSTSNTLTIGRPYLPLMPGEGPFVTDPSNAAAPKLHITLPDLRAWAETAGEPTLLQEVSAGIWEIAVYIDIEDNAQLNLTSSTGVQEVRLISRPEASYNLISDGGTINIDGIKLYSWDNSPGVNTYDTTYLTQNGVMQTRSFLAALNGGRMDIRNAEIMYLGHEELNQRVGFGKGEPSGLAWRLRPPGTDNPASGPKGSIINSEVHHNYFGMYTYEAVGLEIRDSEFYDHYFYGLDPHDYSYGFVVANNIIRDNGYTGLIFSRHCTDNEIYGNEIYNNGSHGFMLDRGSDNNLVYNNMIYDNDSDGIAIYQSSNNVIENNTIRDNARSGIRISAEFDADDKFDGLALDNILRGNTINGNGRDGIYVVDRADRNQILDNHVEGNNRSGLLLNSGLSTALNNTFVNNAREGILINNEPYLTGSGQTGESIPAIGEPATANRILGNVVMGSGQYGIEIDGGRANQIGSLGAGNVITGNVGSGLLLNRTGATAIMHNELYNNVAENGAGILIKCDANSTATQTITENVIAHNRATDLKGRGAGIVIGEACNVTINDNRIYANLNPNRIANLQNKNLVGSPTVDATGNIWALSDMGAIEDTIWHQVDDDELGIVEFEPIGNGSTMLPPTPSPTPTPEFVVTPTPTSTPLAGTPTVTPTPVVSGTGDETIYLPSVYR